MHLPLAVWCGDDAEERPQQTFGQSYAVAERAYLDNDWTNCVKYMSLAVKGSV